MPKLRLEQPKAELIRPAKRFYFLSYSTGEPQIELFAECLDIVFAKHFALRRTPGSLTPGESQHESILASITDCAFGVVCLDGLRPNVIYEYGAMRGASRAVLLFKEQSAQVDIKHFYAGAPNLALEPPQIDLDKHFSNTKDLFCESWSRFKIRDTVKTIWEAYNKAHERIGGYVEIPEPKL
jgi:hypothetical protein